MQCLGSVEEACSLGSEVDTDWEQLECTDAGNQGNQPVD